MVEQTLEQRILELENKVAILTQLSEISAALNSQIELTPLLRRIMEVAVQITSCEAASVLLWDTKKQQLVFAASTTINYDEREFLGRHVPMDSIAGRIYQENRVIQVDDTEQSDIHYNKIDENTRFQTRSLLGVPMTYKNRVIGVLEAINKRQMPWTEDDRLYLKNIAAQAAVAIQGAQLVADLKRANEELQEVDDLKNDFIAIASHELRTPLGVIMGYASFLQEEDNPSTQDLASKVLESALKLRKIIEDMVNLRYLKQHQADLHREKTTVNQLLESMRRELLALMDLSHYDFDVEQLDSDVTLNIDQTRLQMALTNLMHNALSFTDQGGKITLRAEHSSRHEVRIHVQDTGVGIAEDELENIFKEFYQVEDHMIRRHGGLGIGLSITRAIVNAHGGHIWAESDGLGKGSTFTIALPISEETQPFIEDREQ